MIYCPKCGAQNPDGAVMCNNCGNQFAAPGFNPAAQQVVKPAQPGKGLAIASLVCGIVSFFCFGIILGVLSIVFGAVAKKKGFRGGMATAGIVLGCVGLGLFVVTWIACGGFALMPISF